MFLREKRSEEKRPTATKLMGNLLDHWGSELKSDAHVYVKFVVPCFSVSPLAHQ